MGELVATFALAQDNAFGQPLESQLRSCLLAVWLCDEAGLDGELRDTVYWVALLRYIGCTGHAHEVATVFGDEIAIRAQTLVHDAADPSEVMRDVLAFATAGRSPEGPSRPRCRTCSRVLTAVWSALIATPQSGTANTWMSAAASSSRLRTAASSTAGSTSTTSTHGTNSGHSLAGELNTTDQMPSLPERRGGHLCPKAGLRSFRFGQVEVPWFRVLARR